jgi:hypothetical protein
MEKRDLRKKYKYLYQPSGKSVELVDVPLLQFAMMDGEIEPGHAPGSSPAFKDALEALYGISYTLKFMSKLRQDNPIDYPVMALEGLWWVEGAEFDITQPGGWKYTLMMMQPDHITPEMYQEALAQLRKKRGDKPALAKIRLQGFQEGTCIQIMHIGPYSEEMATVDKMDAFAREKGYKLHGKHHEIYIGDPMRAQPEKLKTILRHPVLIES